MSDSAWTVQLRRINLLNVKWLLGDAKAQWTTPQSKERSNALAPTAQLESRTAALAIIQDIHRKPHPECTISPKSAGYEKR